jgi:hypothetical protein
MVNGLKRANYIWKMTKEEYTCCGKTFKGKTGLEANKNANAKKK